MVDRNEQTKSKSNPTDEIKVFVTSHIKIELQLLLFFFIYI